MEKYRRKDGGGQFAAWRRGRGLAAAALLGWLAAAAGCGGGGASGTPGMIGEIGPGATDGPGTPSSSPEIGEKFGRIRGVLRTGTNPAPAAGAGGRVAASMRGARRFSLEADPCSADEAVPGQLVVLMKSEESGGSAGRRAADLEARHGLRRMAGAADFYLFQVEDPEKSGDEVRDKTREACRSLQNDPAVHSAALNRAFRSSRIPNDRLYPLQWHYPAINLPAAWELTVGDPSAVIAVVDTGAVDSDQLNGRIVGGYDFITDPEQAGDGDGPDPDYSDEGIFHGRGSHGSHVSATAAGESDDGAGTAGVAWEASLLEVRVLGVEGWGSLYDIYQGFQYAAGLLDENKPPVRADIINVSLGSASLCGDLEQEIVDRVRSKGVLIVAAAGNGGWGYIDAPARCEGTIAVGALGTNGTAAPYSNYGPELNIAAPGGDMTADRNGDGNGDGVLSVAEPGPYYDWYEGTSMAAPHVSGVLALMLSADPSLSPRSAEEMLFAAAADLGPDGWDESTGWGMLDAYAAVRAAMGGTVPFPAELGFSQDAVSFGTLAEEMEIYAFNVGMGELSVLSVQSSNPEWLTVDWRENGARYRVSLSARRDGLAKGDYEGEARFETTAGAVSLSVSMMVRHELEDIGPVYVSLFSMKDEDEEGELAAAGWTDVSDGYRFSFSNLAAGNYYIVASNDQNGDGTYCGDDDLCGVYPPGDEGWAVSLARWEKIDDAWAVLFKSRSLDEEGGRKAARDPRRAAPARIAAGAGPPDSFKPHKAGFPAPIFFP